MSDRNQNVRGIHYEISEPKQSPYDGYWYQRVRQVDERGDLVGIGEQVLRSASKDGLVVPSVDLMNAGRATWHGLKTLAGILGKNPREVAIGGAELALDLHSGLVEGYKAWPGTDSPWDPPFDWRTGSSPVDSMRGSDRVEIGDGHGIGRWWDASANFSQDRAPRYGWEDTRQGFENVPVPNLAPPLRSPAWNDVFVRDSVAAAGIASRNNVFEHGFPEPGSVRLPLTTPGAARGTGYVGGAVAAPVPFIPAASQSGSGGLPGLINEAGLNDPLNPDASLPGGLAGFVREYLARQIPEQLGDARSPLR